MPISNSNIFKTSLAQTFETAVGSGGRLTFYSGTIPATADTALSGNTALAQLSVASANFMADPTNGVSGLISTLTVTAAATGTMSFYRWETTAGACIQQGSVTATGGGGDITFSSVSVTAGQTVNLTSYTQTAS